MIVKQFHRTRLLLPLLWCLAGCATVPVSPQAPSIVSPPKPYAVPLTSPVRTIVIDAGHGGRDPGTSHYGLREKHLALDIAKRLRDQLQQRGFNVVMTRDSDRFIALSGRPAIANRLKADLFISVHINANKNRGVSGIEVYYPRESVVSASTHWPPWVRSADIALPSSTVKQVLWDMVLGQTRVQSRRLATMVCHAMRDGMQAPCRGVKSARFVVLREAWMPAVLVETGYVSNRTEAKRLSSAGYRQAAAESIARGVLSYVRQLETQHI